MLPDFPAVFRAATGHEPRAYQGRLAARFAAKEAVIKAIGAAGQSTPPGSVPPPPPSWRYTEIEVVSSPGSPPRLALHGAVARHAAALGITAWHLSLSHDAEAALAFVVAE